MVLDTTLKYNQANTQWCKVTKYIYLSTVLKFNALLCDALWAYQTAIFKHFVLLLLVL